MPSLRAHIVGRRRCLHMAHQLAEQPCSLVLVATDRTLTVYACAYHSKLSLKHTWHARRRATCSPSSLPRNMCHKAHNWPQESNCQQPYPTNHFRSVSSPHHSLWKPPHRRSGRNALFCLFRQRAVSTVSENTFVQISPKGHAAGEYTEQQVGARHTRVRAHTHGDLLRVHRACVLA